MSEFHSPGPWNIWRFGKRRIRWVIRRVSMRATNGDAVEWETIATDVSSQANARLIAAAPDLYDALYFLVNDTVPATEAWEYARAALRKVDGE
jgi:hypothetical protein